MGYAANDVDTLLHGVQGDVVPVGYRKYIGGGLRGSHVRTHWLHAYFRSKRGTSYRVGYTPEAF
jgi:hypothetical protein